MMKEALYFHLEDIYLRDEPLPEPKGLEAHLNNIDSNAGDLFTLIQVDLGTMAVAA